MDHRYGNFKYFTTKPLNKRCLIIVHIGFFQFIEQKAWIAKTFPRDRRFENLIAVGDDVLTAETVNYVSETSCKYKLSFLCFLLYFN